MDLPRALSLNNQTQAGPVFYTETTTALTSGAVFTGSTRKALGSNTRINAVFSTVNSFATLGAVLEDSVDGTNWKTSIGVSNDGTGSARISVPICAPFYRVKATQSATGSSSTRIISSQTRN